MLVNRSACTKFLVVEKNLACLIGWGSEEGGYSPINDPATWVLGVAATSSSRCSCNLFHRHLAPSVSIQDCWEKLRIFILVSSRCLPWIFQSHCGANIGFSLTPFSGDRIWSDSAVYGHHENYDFSAKRWSLVWSKVHLKQLACDLMEKLIVICLLLWSNYFLVILLLINTS